MNTIMDIKEKIKGEIFNAKKMDGLGIFLKRWNIFGMRFDNKNIIYDLKNNHYLYSTKISLKKNSCDMNNFRKYYEINSNSLLKSSIIKKIN